MQGSLGLVDAGSREAIAKEIDQLLAAIKESANATLPGAATSSPARAPTRRRTRCPSPPAEPGRLPGLAAADRAPDRPRRDDRGQRLDRTASSATARAGRRQDPRQPARHRRRTCAPATAPRCAAPTSTGSTRNIDALLGVRALNGSRQNRLEAALTRLAEVEESTLTQLSRDRGRRHRQDAHRLQLPAGGLPGRPQGRGEHRPVLAHGLPPLIRIPEGEHRSHVPHLRQLPLRHARDRRRTPSSSSRPASSAWAARATRSWRPTRPRRSRGCTRSTTPTSRCPSRTRGCTTATTRSSCPTPTPSAIGAEDPSQVDVWVTVRAAGELADFSCNLRAPIVVWKGRGHQVINEAPDAPVRAPLFPDAAAAQAA